MLDNLKFAQYVNEERKKLIKSTRERGVYVADNAQLSEVVARNSEIQPYEATSTDKISVTFLDADGTLLKRQYLDIGGTATAPSNPTLDSDYLTFSGWSDTELTNITESKTIYATYTTKDNATYIFIHIPTANKAITLSFGGTITSVDWGDGTTNTTLSHTYSAIGDYVIKVIGGTYISKYILGSSDNNKYVLKCYLSITITSFSSYVFSSCKSLTTVVLHSGITNLGTSAFAACSSLTNITLPNSITYIGGSTFNDCSSLTSITLPSGVTGIDINAFSNCYLLTNINLPSSIKKIGDSAFQNCRSLTTVVLPSGITGIGNYAFSGCNRFNDISIPSSVAKIGQSAFSYCSSLTNITLPSNITSLIASVFSYCNSLSSISIPSSITSLGSGAFSNCYNLQQVVINADIVITIQSDSFSTDAYNTKFYVPDNLVEDYKVATNWVKFADRIYPLSSLGV